MVTALYMAKRKMPSKNLRFGPLLTSHQANIMVAVAFQVGFGGGREKTSERVDETWKKKMQQYREEAKTETMLVFLSYHSKNISLSRSLKPPCWGQKTRMLKPERKSKSAPILKGNLKQRRIKHNTQALYERCGWRSTGLIRDELFLLLSEGDQTLVKTDLQSWEVFRESDLSWIIFCKLAVMRAFKHIIWCARNSDYGHGRHNFTFTLTHTALLKGTEVLVIINSILVHNY